MSKTIVTLAKSGRVVLPFPWENTKVSAPFNQQTHERVMIPFTAAELRNSKGKKAHVQVIRKQNLRYHKENLLVLH